MLCRGGIRSALAVAWQQLWGSLLWAGGSFPVPPKCLLLGTALQRAGLAGSLWRIWPDPPALVNLTEQEGLGQVPEAGPSLGFTSAILEQNPALYFKRGVKQPGGRGAAGSLRLQGAAPVSLNPCLQFVSASARLRREGLVAWYRENFSSRGRLWLMKGNFLIY